MDAYRKGSEFVVDFDVPGIDPASIELTWRRTCSTVSAEPHRHWGDGQGS